MMIAKSDWERLIPHRGSMSLLDTVVEWDDDKIHLTATSHRHADNPLRSDGMLRALHLCEYGAQAMAVHGGLLAQRAGSVAAPGLLVSLRAVQLHVSRIDDLPDALDVYAQMLLGGERSWQYQFRVEHRTRLLALGRAAVINAPAITLSEVTSAEITSAEITSAQIRLVEVGPAEIKPGEMPG